MNPGTAAVPCEIDVYTEWLGIPPGPRPPDYYTLLGLTSERASPEAVERAAHERNLLVRPRCLKFPDEGSALLNEISAAKVCLLDVEAREEYDRALARTRDRDEVATEEPPAQVPALRGAQTAAEVVAAATLTSRYCPHCGHRLLRKATFCVDCAASAVGHAERWLPGAGSLCQPCGKPLAAGQVVCHACQHDHALESRPKLPAGVVLHRPFMARRISQGQLEPVPEKPLPGPAAAPPPPRDPALNQEHVTPAARRPRPGGAQLTVRPASQRQPLWLLTMGAIPLVVFGLVAFAWVVNRPDAASTSPVAPNSVAPAGLQPPANPPWAGPPAGGMQAEVPVVPVDNPARSNTPAAGTASHLPQSASAVLEDPLLNEAMFELIVAPILRQAREHPGDAGLALAARQLELIRSLRSDLAAARQASPVAEGSVEFALLEARLMALADDDPLPRATIMKLRERHWDNWLAALLDHARNRADALLAEANLAGALALADEVLPGSLEPLRDRWKEQVRQHVMQAFEGQVRAIITEAEQRAAILQFAEADQLLAQILARAQPHDARLTASLQSARLNQLRLAQARWEDLDERQRLPLLDVMLTIDDESLRDFAQRDGKHDAPSAVAATGKSRKKQRGPGAASGEEPFDSADAGIFPRPPAGKSSTRRNFDEEKIQAQSRLKTRKEKELFQQWYIRLDRTFNKGSAFICEVSGSPAVYDGLAELAYAVTRAELDAGKGKFKFNIKRDVKSFSNRQKAEQALQHSGS